jgi:hypothetical protein
MRRLKRSYERCVRTTIRMPPALFDRAIRREKERGFPTFSDYIQQLLREDARKASAEQLQLPFQEDAWQQK